MTAMTAATLDALSGGRFRLGLGVSGPQVSEGWHGVRFANPLARQREYVEIVRAALRRERLSYAGEHFTLPLPGGAGKPIKLTVHPVREHIPIYVAAIGPKNLELTGEIADGWLAVFFSPEHSGELLTSLRAGRERAGLSMSDFDVVPTVPLVVGDDVERCADPIRWYAALYSRRHGQSRAELLQPTRVPYGLREAAAEVQDHYLAKRYEQPLPPCRSSSSTPPR